MSWDSWAPQVRGLHALLHMLRGRLNSCGQFHEDFRHGARQQGDFGVTSGHHAEGQRQFIRIKAALRAGSRTPARTCCPRASSARTKVLPKCPLAPVTIDSVFMEYLIR